MANSQTTSVNVENSGFTMDYNVELHRHTIDDWYGVLCTRDPQKAFKLFMQYAREGKVVRIVAERP